MDSIIKTRREKRKCPNDTLELLIKTHPRIYIWGPPGIGKTWTVRRIIERDYIDLEGDVLKSKQATLDLLERGSKFFIDDYESVQDLIGMRELEQVTHLVVVGNKPWKGSNMYTYEFPKKTNDELREISGLDDVDFCKGDIRRLFQGPDHKDVFFTPKEFVRSLLDGTRNPYDYMGDIIEEHGHVMDLIHENYIDSGADPCEILECLSLASIYDAEIYSGKWNLLPYFSVESCIMPSVLIGGAISGDIRPGSMWTKFSSMCMRKKKVHAMCTRKKRLELDVDALMLLRDYFEQGKGFEMIQEYGFQKCDFDVLAHLCLVKKLRVKNVTALKKQCNE
jgi:hypothetical protein